jgi:hypothetical protein
MIVNMTGHKIKSFSQCVAIALVFVTSISCGPKKSVKSASSKDSADLTVINPRPQVSSLELDEAGFRITGLRIGYQSYMASESPAVSYFLPESSAADYVEIMRCNGNEILHSGSGTGTLENTEIGTSTGEDETNILRSSNFWQTAEAKSGCYIIATDYMDRQIFIDNSAPSGDFRYLVRACVDQSRLADTEGLSKRNCSQQVSLSPLLRDYKNKRLEDERLVFAEVNEDRNLIDSLGRHIFYTTIELNNALAVCIEIEGERIASQILRQSITSIIGMGISFAASIYTSGLSDPSSFSSGWESNWDAVWNQRNSSAGLGMAIGNALFNITASADDYPRTCTKAEKADRDRKVLVERLKEAHRIFDEKMQRAETYRKRRVELEDAK